VEEIIIVVTETAYADLEDIENYISQDSPTIARRFIMRIFDKIDQFTNILIQANLFLNLMIQR